VLQEGLLRRGSSLKMLKLYTNFSTHVVSLKIRQQDALNISFSAFLALGLVAFNNNIKSLFVVRQNKPRNLLRTFVQRLSSS
jgi:hypothetical protein